MTSRVRRFTTTVTVDAKGRTHVPVPFDPDDAWGPKPRHLVAGPVGGCRLRGSVDPAGDGDGYEIVLGPTWTRDRHPDASGPVEVTLAPEGSQRFGSGGGRRDDEVLVVNRDLAGTATRPSRVQR